MILRWFYAVVILLAINACNQTSVPTQLEWESNADIIYPLGVGVEVGVKSNINTTLIAWEATPEAGLNITNSGYKATITGKTKGTYTLKATYTQNPNVTIQRKIIITDAVALNLNISGQVNLPLDKTIDLTAVLQNATANPSLKWSVTPENGGQLTVTNNQAVFKPITKGTYTVEVKSALDPSKTATLTIHVAPSIAVELTPSTSAAIHVGESLKITSKVLESIDQRVSWNITPSSGYVLNTTTSEATFTANQTGTYQLTASSMADPSRSATISIQVLDSVKVSLNPSTKQVLEQGQSITVQAQVLNAMKNNGVEWSVSPITFSDYTVSGNSLTFRASGLGNFSVFAAAVEDNNKLAFIEIEVQLPDPSKKPIGVIGNTNLKVFQEGLFTASESNVLWSVSPTTGVDLQSSGAEARITASSAGTYQLTVTDASNSSRKTTVSVVVEPPIATTVQKVGFGLEHSVAVLQDGTLKGWGSNRDGQLALTVTQTTTPQVIAGLTGVKDIAVGTYHTLVLLNTGQVYAFGRNDYGQLGNGSLTNSNTPLPVLSDIQAIFAGDESSFAIKTDGSVWGWGRHDYRQLADVAMNEGDEVFIELPRKIPGLSNVASMAVGGLHGVALKTDGTVWTWGGNPSGELGMGSTDLNLKQSTPTQVLSGVQAISSTASHVVALKSDGTVWTWGLNNYGQIGNGTIDSFSRGQK